MLAAGYIGKFWPIVRRLERMNLQSADAGSVRPSFSGLAFVFGMNSPPNLSVRSESVMSIQKPAKPAKPNLATRIPLGILGGLLGAVVSFFLFQFLHGQGLYFMVLPGALVGLGCGFAARSRSFVFSIIALVIAIPAAIFCEWKTDAYFCDDGQTLMGIGEYISRMVELRGKQLPIFIGLNGLIALWLGRRG